MFRGISTQEEYQDCIKKGLCEEHLKEISQNERTTIKDEFPLKAFRFVRINILYPLLFKTPPKCEKIKRLMEKTPPLAKIYTKGKISEVVDSLLIADSVVIFTLCQLSKICCIGALFHIKKKTITDDTNIKAIQNLLLVERFENADIRHLYPVLQKNFNGCDLDIIRATHCITLLFIRKFCNKPNLNAAIETIEKDIKKGTNPATVVVSESGLQTAVCYPDVYNSVIYKNIAQQHFSHQEFKASVLYCYLAVNLDHTYTEAYCLFIESLLKLKLPEEAFEVAQFGIQYCKKNTKYFKDFKKLLEDKKLESIAPDKKKLTNSIPENSINNSASADKHIPIKKEEFKPGLVDLVDSDSAESDCEVKKDSPGLADTADSDDENKTKVKFISLNEVKEKAKSKLLVISKKKRTISEGSDVQPEEEIDINKINSYLKEASESILADCGYKAVQTFRGPLRNFIESPNNAVSFEECDIVCIKYSYGIAYCKSGGYDDLQKCIIILKDIIENHDSVTFPAAYYSLGLAYRKLNRFKDALQYLEIVQKFLCKGIHFKVYAWPGMTTVIQETKSDILKTLVQDLIKECENPPNPDAFCRYESCSFQPTIYYSDPDFKGYISLSCSEQCYMQYHSQCWKAMKEEKNLTDKEFLEKSCFTPDCEGSIMKIQNIDKKGDLSKEFTSDFKKPSKQKWAKWEKKTDIKEKEKRKKKPSIRSEDDSQEVLTESEKVRSRKNSTISDEPTSQFSGSSNSVEETTSKIENDHKIPQKMNQKAEVDVNSISNNICSSVQENHNASHLTGSCNDSKAELTPEGKSEYLCTESMKPNIYSYMAEFLQHHGPLRIDDPLLVSELEQFPTEVQEIIVEYGGIEEFLKDDLRFAVVGDLYVCVVADLATAYKMSTSSGLPADLKSLQPLEDVDGSQYYEESSPESRRSSSGLNPDAIEFVSTSKSSSYKFAANNSLSHNLNSHFSLPASFEPSSKCSNSLSVVDPSLDTFPGTEMCVSKSKSCETVLNNAFQNNSESIFCTSIPLLEQSGKEVGDASKKCIIKVELPPESVSSCLKIQESSSRDLSPENKDNAGTGTEDTPVSETTVVSDCGNTSRFSELEAQLLPLLKEYYSEEMKHCRESTDFSVKPYIIKMMKEMCEHSSSGTMDDVEFLEENKDFENPTAFDQEKVIEGLKMEIYSLSKQNSLLQDMLKSEAEKQQKIHSAEMAHLKKKLKESTAEKEMLKKEFDKKEQDLMMERNSLMGRLKESEISIEQMKKNFSSLMENTLELEKNAQMVKNVQDRLAKLEKKKYALDTQEKKHQAAIQALEKEKAELTDKTKYAELEVLRIKKTEYVRRIEEKSHEAVERRKEINATMTMMTTSTVALSPVVYNCMKNVISSLEKYVSELNTFKMDFMKQIDEQIKQVENGVFLNDLKNIEMKELPAVPSLKSTYPNGFPITDKSPFTTSMGSSFNFGFGGSSAQLSPAGIAPLPVAAGSSVIPPVAPLSQIIPPGAATAKIVSQSVPAAAATAKIVSQSIPAAAATAKIVSQTIPAAAATAKIVSQAIPPTAAVISPPTTAVIPSTVPAPVSSTLSLSPVIESNKNSKRDTSDGIDITSLNPTIQASFKSAMASINSFASSPYPAPSLDEEFDKKCVVFQHPDPVPKVPPGKPDLPKVPPGLLNSVTNSATTAVARTSSNLTTDPVAQPSSGGEKSFASLDTVPRIQVKPSTSTSEHEKKKTTSSTRNSYEKLLNKLKEQFPGYTQEELMSFVKEFRDQSGKLSGLTMDTIISRINAIIKAKKKAPEPPKIQPKPVKVLVNKKLVPDDPKPLTASVPQPAKKKTAWNIDSGDKQRTFSGNSDDDCTICYDPMTKSSAYKVPCGHFFHEQCIRQWLHNKSNCPVCRVLLLLPEEYPSLS